MEVEVKKMSDLEEFDPDKEQKVEIHMKSSSDGCSFTLTILTDEPLDQHQVEYILLDLVTDMKRGKSSGYSNWIMDDSEMEMN